MTVKMLHRIGLGLCALEFCTQIFADTSRSLGMSWNILVVCQVFFILWGLVLTLGFLGWRMKQLLLPYLLPAARTAKEERAHVSASVWLAIACTAVA